MSSDVSMHAMIKLKPGPGNSVSDADTYSCIHTAHHNTKHQSQAHAHHSRHDSSDAAVVHHIFLDYLLRCGHLDLSILLFRFAFFCWLRCRRLLRRGVSGRNRTGRARGSIVIWLRHYADNQCSLALGRQIAAAHCGLTSRAVRDRPPGDTGACWHKAHHVPSCYEVFEGAEVTF